MTSRFVAEDWPFTPEPIVAWNIHLLSTQDLSENDMRAIARENTERIVPRLRRKTGARKD